MWIAQQLRLRGIWEVESHLTWSELLDWQEHYITTGGMSYAERVNFARLAWGAVTQNWDSKKAKLPDVESFLYPPGPQGEEEQPQLKRRDVALVKSLKAQVRKMQKHAQHAREVENNNG